MKDPRFAIFVGCACCVVAGFALGCAVKVRAPAPPIEQVGPRVAAPRGSVNAFLVDSSGRVVCSPGTP